MPQIVTRGLLVDLRVDEADDRQRLMAIANDTRWQKEHHAWVGLMGIMDSPWVPAWWRGEPSQKAGQGEVDWVLKGTGDAMLTAVDGSGNISAPVRRARIFRCSGPTRKPCAP